MIFGNFMIFSICTQLCSHIACYLLVILQGALRKQSFFKRFSIPKITLGLLGDILNCGGYQLPVTLRLLLYLISATTESLC